MPRLTVDFSDDAFEAVEDMAKKLSTTKADALRKAIALMRYLANEQKEGSKLIIENSKDNTKKEIVQL